MTDLDRGGELINAIGGRIVHDENYTRYDWDSLSLVVTVDDAMSSSSGFVYLDTGEVVPNHPSGFDVLDLFEELQEATARPDGKRWKAALVQIVRATGKMHLEFEWDDADRWKVTPTNLDARREELRPAE
jgi:YD repeat-containing protein